MKPSSRTAGQVRKLGCGRRWGRGDHASTRGQAGIELVRRWRLPGTQGQGRASFFVDRDSLRARSRMVDRRQRWIGFHVEGVDVDRDRPAAEGEVDLCKVKAGETCSELIVQGRSSFSRPLRSATSSSWAPSTPRAWAHDVLDERGRGEWATPHRDGKLRHRGRTYRGRGGGGAVARQGRLFAGRPVSHPTRSRSSLLQQQDPDLVAACDKLYSRAHAGRVRGGLRRS